MGQFSYSFLFPATNISRSKLFILIAFIFYSFTYSYSQSIENVNATVSGNIVVVQFDLRYTNANQNYSVEIFSSHDNYTASLKHVSGDVGRNIKPGDGKKIEWNVQGELGTFKGEITFRIVAEPVLLKLNFKAPALAQSLRRGKSTTVKWEGGNPAQNIRIDLYKGAEKLLTITDTKNTGEYTWRLPADLRKGDDYTLHATNGQMGATSEKFAVRSKIPLVLKAAPVAVVGVLIYILTRPDDPENLPSPPGVPTGG